MMMGQYWLAQTILQIDPKHFQKVATEFKKKLFQGITYLAN